MIFSRKLDIDEIHFETLQEQLRRRGYPLDKKVSLLFFLKRIIKFLFVRKVGLKHSLGKLQIDLGSNYYGVIRKVSNYFK